MKIEEKIKEFGYEWFEPPKWGLIQPVVKAGDFIFVSGNGPITSEGEILYKGQVGKDLDTKNAQKAAERAAFNCLNAVRSIIRDLNKIERIVRVMGFVNSAEGFDEQHEVMNGASEFFIEALGEKGEHTRTALGVSGLPNNISVEVQILVKVSTV